MPLLRAVGKAWFPTDLPLLWPEGFLHNDGVSALLLLRLRLLGLPRLGLRPGAAVLLAQEVAAGNVKPACLSAVDALLALALPARDKRLMSAAKTASSHESSIIIDQLGCAGHCPPLLPALSQLIGNRKRGGQQNEADVHA